MSAIKKSSLKNDPGCARQGVEVERNRAQTRIALTNDVDRLHQGVFKRFSFFLAQRAIFFVGAGFSRARAREQCAVPSQGEIQA
jgi:hypothetical protein